MNAAAAIRTLVVDDEPLAREGLRLLLAADPEARVVGEAGNGPEAVRRFRKHRPDLVLTSGAKLRVARGHREKVQHLR